MQFQICNSGEIWTSVSAAEAHRIVRKRTGALARMIRDARKAEKQELREYHRAERGLQQELREADRRSRALWQRIRVKAKGRPQTAIERKPQMHRSTRSGWLAVASQLPRYSGQIIDRAGRAGIFFRVRYYSSSTRSGVGRRSALYIWQGAHQMDDGRVLFLSNIGETVEEAVAGFEAVELFNREAQAKAKVLFHAIANVPWQLLEMDGGIERMFEIGQRFAEEQFGDRDLPFALALHPPSEEGDRRNWHLHLLFSSRPMVRTGEHEWDIGRMMRREIDNPDAFEAMRHLYARVQTEVVQDAGLNITYTALSNAERGLQIAPQQHLGSAQTARVRRGERDAVNERNWEKSLAGEAALLDEQLRHAQESAAAEAALLDRVEGRAAPMLVAKTPAPHLSIAAPLRPVSTIGDIPQLVATIGDDALPMPMTLPIADLQSVVRPIVAVPAVTAASTFPAMPGVAAVRVRQLQLGAVLKGMDRDPVGIAPSLSVSAVTPKLPLPIISAPSRSAVLVDNTAVSYEIGLSTGVVRHFANRIVDVRKRALALESDTVDQDLLQLFQLLERREAEAMARRDRLHRERLARQRVEAERLRQQQDDERKREEERQRREAEDARRVQAEYEAADALDAMLKAMEVERILIAFDKDDQCVVGDAVLARFGVHLASHAGDAVHEPRGWTLSAKAPADLRRIADAWRHEPALQKALADTATAFRAAQRRMPQATVLVPARPDPGRQGVGPARPGSRLPAESTSRRQILALAAAQRDALTQQWEQDGGLDETQPVAGPVREPQQPSLSPAPARRPFPADRGQER